EPQAVRPQETHTGRRTIVSDRAKAVIGVLTFSQIPLILLGIALEADLPIWFVALLAINQFGLWFFYLSDIRQNERVSRVRERGWWRAHLCFGVSGEGVCLATFIKGLEVGGWPGRQPPGFSGRAGARG